jgi:hypothetical protein
VKFPTFLPSHFRLASSFLTALIVIMQRTVGGAIILATVEVHVNLAMPFVVTPVLSGKAAKRMVIDCAVT